MLSSSNTIKILLRVTSIRFQSEDGKGSVIFAGSVINEQGNITDATQRVSVKSTSALLNGAIVVIGQWWKVEGVAKTYDLIKNGYHFKELQISPHQIKMVKPSGEHIVLFMTENTTDFKGVGISKAQALWEAFENELYTILDNSDIAQLSKVVSTDIAHNIVESWEKIGDSKSLQWLVEKGIKADIGRKILKCFKKETAQKIEENPYRLLAFCTGWKTADKIAMNTFGIAVNDPRRLLGAIEEVIYSQLSGGDTAVKLSKIQPLLQNLLKPIFETNYDIITKAFNTGLDSHAFVIKNYSNDITLHALGPYFQEKTIASEIVKRTQSNVHSLSNDKVTQVLNKFEIENNFALNNEQRAAVSMAILHSFAIICGGAGTGKTTVLKALYSLYDEAGIKIHQMALTGKASKRMTQATGLKSTTIAGFLSKGDVTNFDNNTVIVIDESSMVDVPSMYQLLRKIPSETKIVIVGDPGQLQPIGAGLLLHVLVEVPEVPLTELKVVNRYSGDIAISAGQIREGICPELSMDVNKSIYVIPCAVQDIQNIQIDLYRNCIERNTDVQILEPTTKGNYTGTIKSNEKCQIEFAKNARPIYIFNAEKQQFESLEINEGEPVICTKNHWDIGLQNGSQGKVIKVYSKPKKLFNEENEMIDTAYADIEWDDGKIRQLTEELIDDIELSYSITVHKAQGSESHTIIIPIYKAFNLDRSLLYTAITRAKIQVILIGDPEIARQVITEEPHYKKRTTGLKDIIEQYYNNS